MEKNKFQLRHFTKKYEKKPFFAQFRQFGTSSYAAFGNVSNNFTFSSRPFH